MKTAEEFTRGKPFSIEQIHLNMIEFAKYHVQEALKEASTKASIVSRGDSNIGELIHTINKESILESYPLTNIQ